MTKARIYQPDKTAMQSGKTKTKWLLEFAPEKPQAIDPLMGWSTMTDMPQEIKLTFSSKESAIAYAKRQKIEYEVYEPNSRRPIRKAYADNFKFGKATN